MRLLYLTSPELHGPEVHQLQVLLRTHKANPGPIDGVYGAATARAVREYQRAHGLDVDGIAGPKTWAALFAYVQPTGPTSLPGRAPAGVEAYDWMHARLGMTESPPDSNRCPITAEFGLVGPWCMMTVSLAFKHGAGIILGDDTPAPWGYWSGRGFAYVPAFEAWAKTRGFWQGVRSPEPGWVVCYDWDGDGVVDHVGIVKSYLGGGQFVAIEGNTELGNDSNGGKLMTRLRYMSQVVGFANVSRHQP